MPVYPCANFPKIRYFLMKLTDKKNHFILSLKGWAVFVIAMGTGSLVCLTLGKTTTSDVHVPLIFVLVVLIISMLTDGYFYGILAAVVSVFAVNWAFTYPYWKIDFSVYGYPLTFLTMLAVGIASSMLATRTKEQQKLKLEAEREKTRANLLRAVSHDLRTPLTAISGSISAVLDNENIRENERRELLENARNDAEWLYRMVENLLSVTRMSADGAKANIIKDDELLEEVIGDVAAKFKVRHPGIKVELKVPETIMFVPMDAMLIEQVIINILQNAKMHANTEDAIEFFAVNGEDEIEFHFRDYGVGIPEGRLESIFDGEGLKDGGSGPDSSKGMGIGLSICKTIVRAHGGSIMALNHERGAEFVFTLPKNTED